MTAACRQDLRFRSSCRPAPLTLMDGGGGDANHQHDVLREARPRVGTYKRDYFVFLDGETKMTLRGRCDNNALPFASLSFRGLNVQRSAVIHGRPGGVCTLVRVYANAWPVWKLACHTFLLQMPCSPAISTLAYGLPRGTEMRQWWAGDKGTCSVTVSFPL